MEVLQPLAIHHVGFPPGHVLHMPGINQADLDLRFFKQLRQWNPVYAGQRLSGVELRVSLENVIQVIDGRFEGFENGSNEPWVIIESIDSSFHLLYGDDYVLSCFRAKFANVVNFDPPEIPWRRGRG